jgi:superfamily I DNA/RNA helicase
VTIVRERESTTELLDGPSLLLAGLTAQQQQAVVHDAGPLMVLAGPGTGKTKLITHRIAYLIAQRSVPADSILALTYTRAACGALRDRVAKLLEKFDLAHAASEVTIETYHAFGMRLLRRFGNHIGLERDFELIDSAQVKSLVREIIAAGHMPSVIGQGEREVLSLIQEVGEHLSNFAITPSSAIEFASRSLLTIEQDVDAQLAKAYQAQLETAAKSKRKSKTPLLPPSTEQRARLIDRQRALRMHLLETCQAIAAMEKLKKDRSVVSFGDLLTMPIEILKTSSHARNIIRGTYRACVVDEFQDVNAATIELIYQLFPHPGEGSRSSGPDLCVVGDDDQAIYGFRGSDDRAFARVARLYPGIASVPLTINYRSHKPILDTAQHIIQASTTRFAPDKIIQQPAKLPDHLQESPPPVVMLQREGLHARTDEGAIIDWLSQNAGQEVDWSRYAVLCRSRSRIISMRDALRSAGIPCRVIGRDELGAMDDLGVMDLLMLARLITTPDDAEAFGHLITRPLSGFAPAMSLSGPGTARFIPPLELSDLINQFQTLRLFGDEDRKELSTIPITQVVTADLLAFAIEYFKLKRDDPAAKPQQQSRQTIIDLLEKFHARLAVFRARATTELASETLVALAIEFDVVHSDLPPPDQRADRLQAVIGFLTFARRRQPRLDAPGTLACFVRYFADLDDSERDNLEELSQRVGMEDAIESSESEAESPATAISIMTAHASKGLEFPVVIVAPVGAGGFPGKIRPASDYAELLNAMATSQQGAHAIEPLPHAQRHEAEERRLFYVALTRAEEQLVLSGYLTKTGGGYLNEIFAAMGSDPERFTHLTHEQLADRSELSDAPLTQLVRLSREKLAEQAALQHKFAALRKQAGAIFQRLCQGDASAAAELSLIAQRTLETAELVPTSVDQAGSDDPAKPGFAIPPHVRSLKLDSRKIDLYLKCPACYYIQHVLGLKEPASSSLQLGTVAHKILEHFYEDWSNADAAGEPLPTTEELIRRGLVRLRALTLRRGEAFNQAQSLQLESMLRCAHEKLHPAAGEPVHILEREVALSIRLSTQQHPQLTHQISLRADRLDLLPESSPFFAGPGSLRLIDYKTGYAYKSLTDIDAHDVQLGLYAWALDQRESSPHAPAEPVRGVAEYWLLASGQVGRIPLQQLDRAAIREKVTKVIDGILAGQFPRGSKCTDSESPCRLLYPAALAVPTVLPS